MSLVVQYLTKANQKGALQSGELIPGCLIGLLWPSVVDRPRDGSVGEQIICDTED